MILWNLKGDNSIQDCLFDVDLSCEVVGSLEHVLKHLIIFIWKPDKQELLLHHKTNGLDLVNKISTNYKKSSSNRIYFLKLKWFTKIFVYQNLCQLIYVNKTFLNSSDYAAPALSILSSSMAALMRKASVIIFLSGSLVSNGLGSHDLGLKYVSFI